MINKAMTAMLAISIFAINPTIAHSAGETETVKVEKVGAEKRTGRWTTFDTFFKPKSTVAEIGDDASAEKIALKKKRLFPLLKKNQPVIFAAIPSKSTLHELPTATGNAEWQCLTEALYFEARGEKIPGIFAVAEVIVNRRDSAKFPDTVCKVIAQGAHRKNACQFSYKCDGHKEVYREKNAKELVAKIAMIVLEERAPKLTEGATYYHANFVNPRWARAFSRTATIGKHYFYRG